MKLGIADEDAIGLGHVEQLVHRHSYDVGTAMVIRQLRFRDRAGHDASLRTRRFASMAHSYQAAFEWTITPANRSGYVKVVSALDGRTNRRTLPTQA